jgi:peptidyl-prolyl cis-trans isomerase B (cyclophilin B)
VPSNKRQREVARRRAARQAQRRAELARRRRRRQRLIGLSVVGVLLLGAAAVGLASALKSKKKDTVAATASPTPAPTTPPGFCSFLPEERTAPAANDPGLPPPTKTKPGASYVAHMVLNGKRVRFTIDGAKAPCAAASFRHLAGKHFFDHTPCHRVTSGASHIFVLQCGDPTGTGAGGAGYTLPEENLPLAKGPEVIYAAGTVAMAKGGAPHTTGSQFFLVYKDSPLPPDYTRVGRLTAGLDVIRAIAAGGSTPPGDGQPKVKTTIGSLVVLPA